MPLEAHEGHDDWGRPLLWWSSWERPNNLTTSHFPLCSPAGESPVAPSLRRPPAPPRQLLPTAPLGAAVREVGSTHLHTDALLSVERDDILLKQPQPLILIEQPRYGIMNPVALRTDGQSGCGRTPFAGYPHTQTPSKAPDPQFLAKCRQFPINRLPYTTGAG